MLRRDGDLFMILAYLGDVVPLVQHEAGGLYASAVSALPPMHGAVVCDSTISASAEADVSKVTLRPKRHKFHTTKPFTILKEKCARLF